jgi:quercetin dioxygenase-like cupin family protein
MQNERIYNSQLFLQPSDGEPVRSLVKYTPHAAIIAWHVKPGQWIRPHVHPAGQDTWTVLSGSGAYVLNQHGAAQQIHAGDVVVARANEIHGVHNNGDEALVFISVVSPAEAGFELVDQ